MALRQYQSGRAGTPKAGRHQPSHAVIGPGGINLLKIRPLEEEAKAAPRFDYKRFEQIENNANKPHHAQTDLTQEQALSLQDYLTLPDDITDFLSDEQNALVTLLDVITNSDTGLAFVELAARAKWSITLQSDMECDYQYDIKTRVISLSLQDMSANDVMRSDYFFSHMALSLIHAFRDVWHERQGGSLKTMYNPDHMLLIERIRVADIDIISVMIADELKREGQGELWRHILTTDLNDIACAYASARMSGSKGEALQAAFFAWFEDIERVNSCDQDILDYLDSCLVNRTSRPVMSGAKQPNKHVIERLSALPNKMQYLKGYGDLILTDLRFSTLYDDMIHHHFDKIIDESQATIIKGVAFRDKALAQKIFSK